LRLRVLQEGRSRAFVCVSGACSSGPEQTVCNAERG
jgi:hypothetical protein